MFTILEIEWEWKIVVQIGCCFLRHLITLLEFSKVDIFFGRFRFYNKWIIQADWTWNWASCFLGYFNCKEPLLIGILIHLIIKNFTFKKKSLNQMNFRSVRSYIRSSQNVCTLCSTFDSSSNMFFALFWRNTINISNNKLGVYYYFSEWIWCSSFSRISQNTTVRAPLA